MVSCLLLFLEEEDVLWMMCALIEDLLPPSYFSSTLLGVQTDQRVLRQLIVQYLPALDRLLQEHDIGEQERRMENLTPLQCGTNGSIRRTRCRNASMVENFFYIFFRQWPSGVLQLKSLHIPKTFFPKT